MTSFISHTSIDCTHAYTLAQWWKPVLGYDDNPDDPNVPGDPECWIQGPEGTPPLLFIEVPESKTVKNRLHLDLRPTEGTRDAEVARLLEHGASQVEDCRGIHGPGSGWVVLGDPEGNEFCILRSEAEAAAGTS